MSELISTGGGNNHPTGCTCPFCLSAAHTEAAVTLDANTGDTQPLTATVQPQVWVDDYAIDSGPAEEFRVDEIVSALDERARQRLLAEVSSSSADLDWLYEEAVERGLVERGHGPFYVRVDENELREWIRNQPDVEAVVPTHGTSAFHACPARRGEPCAEHGNGPTWSTHRGDMEVRACTETDDETISGVPDSDAEFYTVYSADTDGLWMAMANYPTREQAESAMQEIALRGPDDIDAVRANVDMIDPLDHVAVVRTAKGALQQLPDERRATLEAALDAGDGPVDWDSPGATVLRDNVYAALVDTTQDVPTRKKVEALQRDLEEARVAVTNAHVDMDLRRGDADALAGARERADEAHRRLDRAERMREQATLRRIAAGTPTTFDAWETEKRFDAARTERRRMVNAADAARLAAVEQPDRADLREKAEVSTRAEAKAVEDHARRKQALDALNEARARQRNEPTGVEL